VAFASAIRSLSFAAFASLAAPAALAAQLNPNDPIHAQGIMENWIRLLFKETNRPNENHANTN
jgi:hypothetical protein